MRTTTTSSSTSATTVGATTAVSAASSASIARVSSANAPQPAEGWKLPPAAPRLPSSQKPESQALQLAKERLDACQLDWSAVLRQATPWVENARRHPAPFWAMESLLQEYPVSSAEGLALMRLAEALLRVPDVETAIALTADQLGRADFSNEHGEHGWLAGLSAQAISLARQWLPGSEGAGGLLKRLGARGVVAATVRAIQLLGRQFVLGQDIQEAQTVAQAQRRQRPGLRFSFDMLGEGARTETDALRSLKAYHGAVEALAATASATGDSADSPDSPLERDGISIKLSALFARYEEAQRARVEAELMPRVWGLVEAAARANLNLTLDAEESERLELSLDIFQALAERIAVAYPQWRGFGLAVQAYQTRALAVLTEVAALARRLNLRFMVRLVKGAYWDAEIKRAQELGLAAYPVFTRKTYTDVNYLACAAQMLADREVIYPQFASHNAATLAAIDELARAAGAQPGSDFELQRLHGMGEAVYRERLKDARQACRVYAPVGEHRDLLAYLVRRLLENGANSSFVHQLADPAVPPAVLLASPLEALRRFSAAEISGLPLPPELYGPGRRNATGVDLACRYQRQPLLATLRPWQDPAVKAQLLHVPVNQPADIHPAMQSLEAGFAAWNARPLAERCAVLNRAADLLESRLPDYVALLAVEAHKSLPDGVAEVREAVDFCRYYAQLAETRLAEQELPGPTGERNVLRLGGRGVFVCISPWNFPLAIFAGQIVAALVCGNSVAAKPAEQTPAVARAFVQLLLEAGLPSQAIALLHGPGETIGAGLVAHSAVAGVCFTGSTAVAKHIQRALAAKDGPIVPLIAETGGLNAMLVDSTALPEQVVDAVVQSAFRSAGQRCSALRLLCLPESTADHVLHMLAGAMAELRLGPAEALASDVGPLIDGEAWENVAGEVRRLESLGSTRIVARTPWPADLPVELQSLAAGAGAQASAGCHWLAPVAVELQQLEDLQRETFGPLLHVLRWGPNQPGLEDADKVVTRINALGYGLTFGLQTRIDSRAERLARAARVGNVYVNRNIVGAVVGVQPFGGEGLSGTGPKAGGPHYLYRFCAEQTVTVNTAAAGGNVALLLAGG